MHLITMPRLFRPLLGSALLLCACAQHKQHQTESSTVLGAPRHRSTTDKVAVVEFDSNGTYWDKQQLHNALKKINDTPKPLLITFIHGWRHNARPDDADLQQFAEFIHKLDRNKALLAGGFTPIGLYIGWRGASINEHAKGFGWLTTLPAIFSFWNIKHGTDRVALRGDLGNTLNQTTAAAWREKDGKSGKSVMIGHSFGGRILEMVSTNQATVQTNNLAQFRPLADLVVLINPASESLNARQAKLSLEGWNQDYPLFIAIGAMNDKPNAKAWPLGYALARQPRTRDYHIHTPEGLIVERQTSFLNKTVANDQRQITHVLKEKPGTERTGDWNILPLFAAKKSAAPAGATKTPMEASIANLKKPKENDDRIFWLRTSDDPTDAHPFEFKRRDANTVQGVDYVYDSKAYWVFQVPTSILSGHGGDRKNGSGGVLNAPMTDLMEALLSSASLEKSRLMTAKTLAPSSGDSPKAKITGQSKNRSLSKR